MANVNEPEKYPLLLSLLAPMGRQLQGKYTLKDAAEVFSVSIRTIEAWVHDGKLPARDLPGRSKFLSCDLEHFLQNSLRKPAGGVEEADSSAEGNEGHPWRVPTKHVKRIPKPK